MPHGAVQSGRTFLTPTDAKRVHSFATSSTPPGFIRNNADQIGAYSCGARAKAHGNFLEQRALFPVQVPGATAANIKRRTIFFQTTGMISGCGNLVGSRYMRFREGEQVRWFIPAHVVVILCCPSFPLLTSLPVAFY